MRIADTSALYALFVAEDTHHADAQRLFEDPDRVVVPTEIFVETVALLQFRHGFTPAVQAGAGLRDLPHVEVLATGESVGETAWSVFSEAGGKLSLPDAYVIAWCRAEDARPLTFDREILRRV